MPGPAPRRGEHGKEHGGRSPHDTMNTIGLVEIEGRAVVVTGGASGIGRALARRFHADGARGIVVADRDRDGAVAVAAELDAGRPGSALAVACDVGVDAEVADLVRSAEEAFGAIDLFCANAGIGVGTGLGDPRRGLGSHLARQRDGPRVCRPRTYYPVGWRGARATSSRPPRPPAC